MLLLLNSGANPNTVTGPPRKTPLHIAASGGHLNIVQSLINVPKPPGTRLMTGAGQFFTRLVLRGVRRHLHLCTTSVASWATSQTRLAELLYWLVCCQGLEWMFWPSCLSKGRTPARRTRRMSWGCTSLLCPRCPEDCAHMVLEKWRIGWDQQATADGDCRG